MATLFSLGAHVKKIGLGFGTYTRIEAHMTFKLQSYTDAVCSIIFFDIYIIQN